MQGLWKEHIGGWSQKGDRRKKSSKRKYTLKEKGYNLEKRFDNYYARRSKNFHLVDHSKYREDEFQITSFTEAKNRYRETLLTTGEVQREVQLYKCDFYYYPEGYNRWDKTLEEHDQRIYFNMEVYYNTTLNEWMTIDNISPYRFLYNKRGVGTYVYKGYNKVNLGKRYLDKAFITELEERKKLAKLKTEVNYETYANTVPFYYGKPVYHWQRMTWFNDGKRRKFYQKVSNRKGRARVKQWIDNGDYDIDYNPHPIEKSIAWEIN